MTKPLSPDEALTLKHRIIPDVVIDAVNRLLSTKFDGCSCTLYQNEVIDAIQDLSAERRIPFSRHALFASKSLDFESVFEKEGWSVYYDKPAYCETYEPYWTFQRA